MNVKLTSYDPQEIIIQKKINTFVSKTILPSLKYCFVLRCHFELIYHAASAFLFCRRSIELVVGFFLDNQSCEAALSESGMKNKEMKMGITWALLIEVTEVRSRKEM